MSDVVYTSNVRIERVKGPRRRAYLPVESEPVWFGVHSEVATERVRVSGVRPPQSNCGGRLHPATA
jgi:hypothetical protein